MKVIYKSLTLLSHSRKFGVNSLIVCEGDVRLISFRRELSVMHSLSLDGKFLCHFSVVHPKLSQEVSTESG